MVRDPCRPWPWESCGKETIAACATCKPTLPAITQVKSEEEDQQNRTYWWLTVQRVPCENLRARCHTFAIVRWASAALLSTDQSSTSRTRKIATNVEWLRETENYAWRKDATGRVAQLPCCYLLTAHLTEEQQSIAYWYRTSLQLCSRGFAATPCSSQISCRLEVHVHVRVGRRARRVSRFFRRTRRSLTDGSSPDLFKKSFRHRTSLWKIRQLCFFIQYDWSWKRSSATVWEIPRSRYTHVTGRRRMSAVVFACRFEELRLGHTFGSMRAWQPKCGCSETDLLLAETFI